MMKATLSAEYQSGNNYQSLGSKKTLKIIRRSTFDQIEEFSITVLVAPILSSPNSNEITETHSQNYEVVGYCTAKNSKPASVITWIAPPERFHQIFKGSPSENQF